MADVEALITNGGAAGAFMLPKVSGPGDVLAAAARLEAAGSAIELAAIIETAEGLEHCASIARAHARLRSLYFGGFDLSSALGCAMAWEPLLYARSRVVHAAALAGIEALDSPYPGTTDLAGLAADCARVKALGMTGRCTKHASHVTPIRRAFSATAEEIARARQIVGLFRRDPTRPLTFEGRLVELPAIRRLERIADQTPES
jgi:citrate lyase beta subunit